MNKIYRITYKSNNVILHDFIGVVDSKTDPIKQIFMVEKFIHSFIKPTYFIYSPFSSAESYNKNTEGSCTIKELSKEYKYLNTLYG